MRRFLFGLVFVAFNLVKANSAFADNCSAFDKALIFDAKHTFSVEIGDPSNKKTVYVMAAPWCQPCTNLYQAYLQEKPSFNLKISMMSLVNEHHDKQAIDFVVNGIEGAHRTYGSKSQPQNVSSDYEWLISAIEMHVIGIKDRLEKAGKHLASPWVFLPTKNGVMTFAAGNKSVADARRLLRMFQEDVVVDQYPPEDFDVDEINRSINGMFEIEPRNVYAGEKGAMIYSFPHVKASAHSCSAKGYGYRAVGKVVSNGETFYKVEAGTRSGRLLFAFMREAELSLSSRK
ncbi:hypothetical protein J7481_22835 [Labrenzia sp. R4_2]|uniref:hypothetical protein n=1 Tax=Labrenzia sp. R4_2 TaxID=2821107 RepID=UPI001ADD5F93|nr:hypothetical protein [Labrenzia sp. R4_2]MBO9422365.1 hypothetical protein [Labrenzia sp. R4_2]